MQRMLRYRGSHRERRDLPRPLETGGKQLGGGVWKREQKLESMSGRRAPLEGGGMEQLAPCLAAQGRAQVPTGQSSSGLVCPRPGSTWVKAGLPKKLHAGEKQPLLVTPSRRGAEGAGVL